MKLSRFDHKALEFLLENDMGLDMGMDDGLDMGMDDGLGLGDDPSAVVMEIEPTAPVSAIDDSEDKKQVKSDLKKLIEFSGRLQEICDQSELEPWMVAKLSKAAEYVVDIFYCLDSSADYANMGAELAPDSQGL